MSRYLRSAGLDELWCGDHPDSFRVVWEHSYRAVVVAAATRVGNRWEVVATQFNDPRTGGNPALVDTMGIAGRFRRFLTTEEADDLVKDNAFLWRPSRDDQSTETDDGASYVFEGRQSGVYRVVSRVNADDPAAEDAMRRMVRAAGMVPPLEMESRESQSKITQATGGWGPLKTHLGWVWAGEATESGWAWNTPPRLVIRSRKSNATFVIPQVEDHIEVTAPTELHIVGFANTGERLRDTAPSVARPDPSSLVGTFRATASLIVTRVASIKTSTGQSVWIQVRPGNY